MQEHATAHASHPKSAQIIPFATIRHVRYQRLARELLLWPIWLSEPVHGSTDDVAAATIRRGSGYDFMVSPRLTRLELVIAAYACAVRVVSHDCEIDGIRFAYLAELHDLFALRASIGRVELAAYTERYCLGAEDETAVA